MPSLSGRQHRAMEAAAHGKSTLKIPKSVGEDFSEADRGHHFKDHMTDRAQDILERLDSVGDRLERISRKLRT